MISDNPSHTAQVRWLVLALLLGLGGGAAWQFHESRRPLSSYQPATGVVQRADLRQTTDKNKAWYIEVALTGQSAPFWVSSSSPALLTVLQQAQMQQATATVYHDGGNGRAYQLEVFGEAVYPLDEGHCEAAGSAAMCLLLLAITLPLALKPILEKLAAPAESDA